MRKSIGERLKEERIKLGKTQSEFAEIGNASKRSQIDWEKGVSVPNAEFLALIAAAGADVLYILTGQRTPTAEASLSREEYCLLDNYRHCSPEAQKSIQGIHDQLAQPKKRAA